MAKASPALTDLNMRCIQLRKSFICWLSGLNSRQMTSHSSMIITKCCPVAITTRSRVLSRSSLSPTATSGKASQTSAFTSSLMWAMMSSWR